jgi:hypothetical protein
MLAPRTFRFREPRSLPTSQFVGSRASGAASPRGRKGRGGIGQEAPPPAAHPLYCSPGGARRAPPGGLRPKRSRRRPAKICTSHCNVCVEQITCAAASEKPRRQCEALLRAGAKQPHLPHRLRSDAPAAVAENRHLEPRSRQGRAKGAPRGRQGGATDPTRCHPSGHMPAPSRHHLRKWCHRSGGMRQPARGTAPLWPTPAGCDNRKELLPPHENLCDAL